MVLLVGLGNPEHKYEHTRHNAGFMAIDAIAEQFGFPAFTMDKKANALLSEGVIKDEKIILVKPHTYMNSSGKAVKTISLFYKIPPEQLIVIHDDIDIPLGETRAVQPERESGSAGHRGIESIIKELGTKKFWRFRIGILPSAGKPEDVETFVLRPFSSEEKELIEDVVENIPSLISEKIAAI